MFTAFCPLGEIVNGDVGLVGDGVLADVVLDPAVRNLPLLGIDPRQVGVVGLQGANSINKYTPQSLSVHFQTVLGHLGRAYTTFSQCIFIPFLYLIESTPCP